MKVEKATKFSHTFRLIERLQTRIATLKLLRKQELYKADHNKSDQDKLNGEIYQCIVLTFGMFIDKNNSYDNANVASAILIEHRVCMCVRWFGCYAVPQLVRECVWRMETFETWQDCRFNSQC